MKLKHLNYVKDYEKLIIQDSNKMAIQSEQLTSLYNHSDFLSQPVTLHHDVITF